MAIIMTPKISPDASKYFKTPQEIEKAKELLDLFRLMVHDHDKSKNISEENEFTFSDMEIYGLMKIAINDINSGFPATDYTIVSLNDDSFVCNGTFVAAMISKGMLETKNSLDYNDQGIAINTFNKGPAYQTWVSIMLQTYQQSKMQVKMAERYRNMFVGIGSDFGRMG